MMPRLSFLLLCSFLVLGINAASSVIDLLPSNFDQLVLKSGKPALVEFFAPWCGHCQALVPVWEDLATKFEFAKDKVTIARVDADDHKELGRRFGVQGFPTLKWFDGKSDKPTDYNAPRDLDSLSDFIIEKTGIKIKSKKPVLSAVEMLTDQTFKKHVGSDKDVFVAFTASWCGHCKTLAPIWETLANDFAAEPTVVIGKVDATAQNSKSTAENQGVKSYPTIKFFPKGSSTAEDYDGGRTEEDFIEFLNGKAGTHRVLGGGLDDKAGTIASLDEVIIKLASGGDVDAISKEVTRAATGIKDKYAEYYVKVLVKLVKSRDYAEKELKRLEGLIKKGGLAQQKLDDLISRSNILRKFSNRESAKEEL